MVWMEELGLLKNLMTSSEIEPATAGFATQWLNQLRYRMPQI
jgi:hypothetical protein